MAVTKLSNSGVYGDKYISFLAGNPAYDPGGYYPIASTTVGSGGSSSVAFTSIPSDYTHLQVRMIARTNRTSPEINDYLNVRFNSDSGSNYARHRLYGNGASVTASANSSIAQFYIEHFPAAGSAANVFGAAVMDILDYKNANKYKTVRMIAGKDENATDTGLIFFHSALWMSTSAITSITLTPGSGTLITQYSEFSLYGIKVAS